MLDVLTEDYFGVLVFEVLVFEVLVFEVIVFEVLVFEVLVFEFLGFEVFVFEVLVFVIFVLEKLSCLCCPFTLLRFSLLKLHQRVFQNENMHILEGILGNVLSYTCWYKKLVFRWQKF